MKSILLLAGCLGIVALLSIAEAYPQRVYVQKLPYYPPPTSQPVIQRAKREVTIEDSVAKSPKGGADVSVKVTKTIGNDNVKAAGSVFAAGNTNGGAFTKGVSAGVAGFNDKGELTKSLTVGVEKTNDDIRQSFTKQAEANLRLGDHNSLTGKVSQTDTKISGLDFKPHLSSSSLSLKNDLGITASISRDVNRGVGSELTKSLSANIFDSGDQRLDGSLFHTKVRQTNGFDFTKTGGALDYSHVNGHGLTAGLTRISGIGDQASLSGRTNLYRSNDGLSSLNANFGGSKWLNGPFTSQRDYNFGLGYSYNGWRG